MALEGLHVALAHAVHECADLSIRQKPTHSVAG